jgi:hypothetical protein
MGISGMAHTRMLVCATLAITVLGANSFVIAQRQPKPAKVVRQDLFSERNGRQAISGQASTARHCVGPSGANVHPLGWVPAETDIKVTFTSDFDPVAAITIVQMGEGTPDGLARAGYLADDDSGGNLEPEVQFTSSYAGTLTLHVSKFSPERQAGCYFIKVEIQTP